MIVSAFNDDEVVPREQRLGVLDASARVEERILRRVRDAETERGSVAERVPDHLAVPVEVDHDVGDPEAPQQREIVGDERPAADLDHRFRTIVGERAEASPEPGREHHRSHLSSSNRRPGTAPSQSRAANSAASPPATVTSAKNRRAVASTSGRKASGAGLPFSSAI